MAVTYESLASTTLGSAQSSVTFSGISGIYTDLILIAQAKFTANPSYSGIVFNNDSGSNYSSTFLRSTGSAASSGTNTNAGQISSGSYSTNFTLDIFNIQNYSNSTVYKCVLYKTNQNNDVLLRTGTWRNTAAITSVKYQIDSGNLDVGSTFTLYGVKAA